jgi:hypothetical protein
VHPKLAAAVAHHHRAIPRETTAIDANETQPAQPREQLGRVPRRGIELEGELVVRPREQPA